MKSNLYFLLVYESIIGIYSLIVYTDEDLSQYISTHREKKKPYTSPGNPMNIELKPSRFCVHEG